MSERRIDALSRRIWRELYREPPRLAVVRALFQRLMKAGATNPPPQSAQLLRMEDYRA